MLAGLSVQDETREPIMLSSKLYYEKRSVFS